MIICPHCNFENKDDDALCQKCNRIIVQEKKKKKIKDPLIGRQIGNHKIIERIGVGGMGVVYLAEHIHLKKKFAIKFLHPQFSADEEIVERFRREAEVISRLEHPNIIRETDFGWLDGIGLYLIMEYLDGITLKELIKREEALPPLRVANIFQQLLDALAFAHDEGIVHRDLKPENIFLLQKKRKGEIVKILDFGIARVLFGKREKEFTIDGEVYGSPTYMSPEQARGEVSKVDHRADIYSAGVILVETLTGRPPFYSKIPAEIMLSHISSLPPRLSELRPDLLFAPELEDVVIKALAKEPEDRYPDALTFFEELEPALEKTEKLRKKEKRKKEIKSTIVDFDLPNRLPEVSPTTSPKPNVLSLPTRREEEVKPSITPPPQRAKVFQRGQKPVPMDPNQFEAETSIVNISQILETSSSSSLPQYYPMPNSSDQQLSQSLYPNTMESPNPLTPQQMIQSDPQIPKSALSLTPTPGERINVLTSMGQGETPVNQKVEKALTPSSDSISLFEKKELFKTRNIAIISSVGALILIIIGWLLFSGGSSEKNLTKKTEKAEKAKNSPVNKPPKAAKKAALPKIDLKQNSSLPDLKVEKKGAKNTPQRRTKAQQKPVANPKNKNFDRPEDKKNAVFYRLEIITEPPGADVLIEGLGKVAETPYILRAPKGSRVKIYLQKKGYLSSIIAWDADKNGRVVVVLKPSYQ